MKLFPFGKRSEPTPVIKSLKETIPADHISKKKKNTYTIAFSPFYDETMFSLCPKTPLGVKTLNGKEQSTSSGWISCQEFPNPEAIEFAKGQPKFKEILGDRIATTIIEYLDKKTGEPVVLLYPNIIYIFDKYENDYMEHMNHATRRDLLKQIKLRERLYNEYCARQNQK